MCCRPNSICYRHVTKEQAERYAYVLNERSEHQDRMQQAQRVLEIGAEHVDINEILRISPLIRDGVYLHISELLKRFIETEQTCVELCNCRLEEL